MANLRGPMDVVGDHTGDQFLSQLAAVDVIFDTDGKQLFGISELATVT